MHCRTIHYIFLLISILYTFTSCTPQNQLISILKQDEAVFNVVKNPKYEVQILYTHVDLADTSFASHQIHVDASRYFYPASTVKLPVAILTLQKFNQLVGQGIDIGIEDDLLHGIDHPSQSPAFVDTTTQTKKPNAKRYIEKIFSISDNDAYNRLYEFLGQDYINQQLSDKKVIQHSVINHRVGVSGYDFEANQYTNPVRIFRDQKMMYDQLPAQAKPRIHNALNAIKGIGYFDQNDSLINKPFDFRYKNFYSIQDMESTLKRIIFPQKYKAEQQFELNEDDFVFLKKVMSDFQRFYSNLLENYLLLLLFYRLNSHSM